MKANTKTKLVRLLRLFLEDDSVKKDVGGLLACMTGEEILMSAGSLADVLEVHLNSQELQLWLRVSREMTLGDDEGENCAAGNALDHATQPVSPAVERCDRCGQPYYPAMPAPSDSEHGRHHPGKHCEDCRHGPEGAPSS